MNDTAGFFLIAGVCSVFGGLVGYFLYRIKYKADRRMSKIINDPILLVRELKKNGKIYDIGPNDVQEGLEFVYDHDPKSGDGRMVIKRTPVSLPKLPKIAQLKPAEKRKSKLRRKAKASK